MDPLEVEVVTPMGDIRVARVHVFGTFGQDARPLAVGALRLEASPRYQGGTRPGVRAWLREMGRWMRLMDYPQTKWIDIITTRTEGAA